MPDIPVKMNEPMRNRFQDVKTSDFRRRIGTTKKAAIVAANATLKAKSSRSLASIGGYPHGAAGLEAGSRTEL